MKLEATGYNRIVVIDGLEILINYTGDASGTKAVKLDGEIIPEILRRWEAFPDLYAVLREFVIQHEMGLQHHIEGLYDLARTALDKATGH